MKIYTKYPVSLDEALKRLSDKLNLECMFQQDERTQIYKIPRPDVVALLEHNSEQIEESGYFGQRINMGLHIPIVHRTLGPGWLFVETRAEARIPDELIEEREKQKAAELGI